METRLTETQFLKEVADHRLFVLRDDGLNRHLRFKRPDSTFCHFDVITWPGCLCFTGDMGTYVFRRLEDMFDFFRAGTSERRADGGLHINPGYWSEKLQAADRDDGYKAFSLTRFKEAVKEQFDAATEDEGWAEAKRADLWEEIESSVLNVEDEYEAVSAVRGFYSNLCPTLFDDFWEHRLTEYSHRFIWCCYALAWAVQQYDLSTSVKAA